MLRRLLLALLLVLQSARICAFISIPVFSKHLQTSRNHDASVNKLKGVGREHLKMAMVSSDEIGLENVQQMSSFYDWQPKAIVILIAALLGVLSQTLINSMLKGDQGLSAFLSDGKGYGNSKFKPRLNNYDDAPLGGDDPLPWLKLPKFSYVDVAGQENEEEMVAQRLEELAKRGKEEVESGQNEKAAETMRELESLMKEYGFEYKEER